MRPAESVPSRPADSDPSVIAGRFELVGLLARGRLAIVHEAIDHDLGRRVALKLFTGLALDELEAALREARAMARLNHDNVLAVHDIGEHLGTPFLAIEYAQMDLRRWLAGGPHSQAEILAMFCAAGRGLEAAHRAGLVHHDFKPANVLIRTNGTAAVGDFGLARHLDTADEALLTGSRVRHNPGTLRYSAPERLRGLAGDERSDQFSFCVALWEALLGGHPFTGSAPQRRLESIALGPRPTLAKSKRRQVASHIIRALRRGLSCDPYDRFENLTELLAVLEQPQPYPALRWLSHRARPLLTSAMLVGVFALGVGVSREAPALDVSITPTAVLTADAAMSAARDATLDGRYRQAVKLLMNLMPVVRTTDPSKQREYLTEVEALGDLLSNQMAYTESAIAYAAARKLAIDLQLNPSVYENKRASAQTRAVTATATRGK